MKENLNNNLKTMKDEFINKSKHLMEKIDYIKMSEYLDEIPKKLNEFTEKLHKMAKANDNSNTNDSENFGNSENGKEKVHNLSDVFLSQLISRWPLFVFLVSAIICLGSSAVYHWFGAHSPKTMAMLARLDYAGISILIAGSCYPPYYYFFYCEPFIRTGYLLFISILATAVFIYSFDAEFAKPHMRKIRGSLFITLGVSAGIPIIHLTFFG